MKVKPPSIVLWRFYPHPGCRVVRDVSLLTISLFLLSTVPHWPSVLIMGGKWSLKLITWQWGSRAPGGHCRAVGSSSVGRGKGQLAKTLVTFTLSGAQTRAHAGSHMHAFTHVHTHTHTHTHDAKITTQMNTHANTQTYTCMN